MLARAGFGWVGVLAAIGMGLWLADRLLLWLERREWIYWRRRKGTPSRASVASAALEMHALLEPEKRYVLVLKKQEKALADDEGAPPDPARPRRDS